MSEQDYLDAAYKELRGENRKEGLWLACLKEENGDESMAAGRYVIERAKSMQGAREGVLGIKQNSQRVGGMSFSAVGAVEDISEDEISELSYPEKKEPITRNWKLIAFAVIAHLVLGVITIDILKQQNSIIIQSVNSMLNSQVEKVKKRYSRYQDVGLEHFRDTQTGIVWLNRVLPINDAIRLVQSNTSYRFPNLHELSSLVDCGKEANRMPLELINATHFRQTHLAHNGQCYGTVKSPPMPEAFGGFRGTLISRDTLRGDISRVWGISAVDGGARLYERRRTVEHAVLIRTDLLRQ